MKTFIILYRQGLKGQTLGWFGQFETEELAREAFPFPTCSIHIIKVLDATEYEGVNLSHLIEDTISTTIS